MPLLVGTARLVASLLWGIIALLVFGGCAGAERESSVTARLQKLRQELRARPKDPAVHYFVAYYEAQRGDSAAALASLRSVLEFGRGFVPTEADFPSLAHIAAFSELLQRFRARVVPVTDAKVTFSLPDVRFAPEGIALDTIRGDFFIGSVAQQRIVRVDQHRQVKEFSRSEDSLSAVLGLHIDPDSRRLYAVTSNGYGAVDSTRRTNAIVAYDLATHQRLARWRIPNAGAVNDIAVCGDIAFVSDIALGSVWRIELTTGDASPLVRAGMLYGANGIATSSGCQLLYVAHNLGVAVVDAITGRVRTLGNPRGDNLAAIDGLYRWNRWLIGVQSVSSPGRVVAMRLDSTAQSVDSVVTLQSHHNALFDTPTTGAIGRGVIHVLARTQIGLYDAATDRFTDTLRLRPPVVIEIRLPEENFAGRSALRGAGSSH